MLEPLAGLQRRLPLPCLFLVVRSAARLAVAGALLPASRLVVVAPPRVEADHGPLDHPPPLPRGLRRMCSGCCGAEAAGALMEVLLFPAIVGFCWSSTVGVNVGIAVPNG